MSEKDRIQRIEEYVRRAISCQSSPKGGELLGAILRDADMLDAVGAVGLMRAFTSKYALPEYDPENVRGQTWGMTGQDFSQRFAARAGIGSYIVDQANFQISFYDNLNTPTAKGLAAPLVAFMQAFVQQLQAEVNGQNHFAVD